MQALAHAFPAILPVALTGNAGIHAYPVPCMERRSRGSPVQAVIVFVAALTLVFMHFLYELRANPIYSSILASDDLQAAAFYLQLDTERSSDTVVGKQVVGDVLRTVDGFRAETGIRAHVVGPPVLRGAWTDRVMRDLCVFLPVAMLLVVGALYAIFRSFYLTILPFVIIGIPVIWTMGLVQIFSEATLLIWEDKR